MATAKITAPKLMAVLDDHLTKHEDIFIPMLKKHEKTLYGPDGDDGLCFDVREIVNGFKTIKGVGIAVVIAIVVDLVTRLISITN